MTRIALAALCVLLSAPAWGQEWRCSNGSGGQCMDQLTDSPQCIASCEDGSYLVEMNGRYFSPPYVPSVMGPLDIIQTAPLFPFEGGHDHMIPAGGHLVETPQGIAIAPKQANPILPHPGAAATRTGYDCPPGVINVDVCKVDVYTTYPRAYTLDDIDRMRAAVWKMMTIHYPPCRTTDTNVCAGSLISADPSNVEVEVQLHTYMAAGVSPEELETKASHQP